MDILNTVNFFKDVFQTSKYKKVLKYIEESETGFFVFDKLSNELNIDKSDLKNILRKMDAEGTIKNEQMNGADKYTYFFRL